MCIVGICTYTILRRKESIISCTELTKYIETWAILEICLSCFWLCMCYAYGGLGASSPREILIFRRSETTSSAFSGIMNSIWEKLHYAYSQNNIQHILTCKSIMNPKCYILVLVFCKPGLRNRKATQLLAHLHQIK